MDVECLPSSLELPNPENVVLPHPHLGYSHLPPHTKPLPGRTQPHPIPPGPNHELPTVDGIENNSTHTKSTSASLTNGIDGEHEHSPQTHSNPSTSIIKLNSDFSTAYHFIRVRRNFKLLREIRIEISVLK